MAAALGIDAAPGYALGRTYDDFGFEFVAAKGNKAFEGEGDLWLRRPRLTWMLHPSPGAALAMDAAPCPALLSAWSDLIRSLLPACLLSVESEDAGGLALGLAAFIKAEKLPPFTEFTQQTSQAIFGSGINHQVCACGVCGVCGVPCAAG